MPSRVSKRLFLSEFAPGTSFSVEAHQKGLGPGNGLNLDERLQELPRPAALICTREPAAARDP